MKTLATSRFRFGHLSICEDEMVRWLAIEEEIQGRSFVFPTSRQVVQNVRPGPGPLSGSTHMLAWLLAGTQHPAGKVLMIGLGSGTGVVSMLYNFPEMTMTVIEIDPQLVRLVVEYFPLVEYYIDSGRLKVVLADAREATRDLPEPYDLIIVDAFDGRGFMVLDEVAFYKRLKESANEIWINTHGIRHDPAQEKFLQILQDAGCPAACIVSPQPSNMTHAFDESVVRNWIFSTRFPTLSRLSGFQPYGALSEPAPTLDLLRRSFQHMLGQLERLTATTHQGSFEKHHTVSL